MTVPAKILICDDDPGRAERWRKWPIPHVSAEVKVVAGEELAEELEALAVRRVQARKSHADERPDSEFDQARIAVLDYDLTPTDPSTIGEDNFEEVVRRLRHQSGEGAAYLVRCYSRASVVVVVNQRFKESTFDVTMQRFASSFADLNISQRDLRRAALWTGIPQEGEPYNPWHWPVLASDPDRWQVVRSLIDLEATVVDDLPFSFDRLVARQQDFLGAVAAESESETAMQEVTFDDVVASADLGMAIKDQQKDPELRKQIAVSIVMRWIRQMVWPAQNALIDLPHAVVRFPRLLGEAVKDAAAWDLAARKGVAWEEVVPEDIVTALDPSNKWTPVPTVDAETLRSVAAELPPEDPELFGSKVFCEDTSRFSAVENAKAVSTDLPGPNQQRWIEQVDVRYDPRRRLLM